MYFNYSTGSSSKSILPVLFIFVLFVHSCSSPAAYDATEPYVDGTAIVRQDEVYKQEVIVIPAHLCEEIHYSVYDEFHVAVDTVEKVTRVTVHEHFNEIAIATKVYDPSKEIYIVKKYGLIDRNGKVLIPVIYHRLLREKDIIRANFNDKKGYFDNTGKILIPVEYDMLGPLRANIAPAAKGGKWGFVDLKGTAIVPLVFDSAGFFSEGLATVKKEGMCGVIDKSGKVIIPFKYERVEEYREGLMAVRKDGKWGFIDTTDREIVPLVYHNVVRQEYPDSTTAYGFRDGYAEVQNEYLKVALMNRKGELITGFNYKDIVRTEKKGPRSLGFKPGFFSEGYAIVMDNLWGSARYGFIDSTGAVIVSPKYVEVSPFLEGKAWVKEDANTRGKMINTKGEVIEEE
jgi:hypothetical protein